jgi:hypothetical protein
MSSTDDPTSPDGLRDVQLSFDTREGDTIYFHRRGSYVIGYSEVINMGPTGNNQFGGNGGGILVLVVVAVVQ